MLKGFEPMLCDKITPGARYDVKRFIVEPKYDGQRAVVIKDEIGGHPTTEIWARPQGHKPATEMSVRYPDIVEAVAPLPVGVYDGEITVPGPFKGILKRKTDDPFKVGLLRKTLPATFNIFDVLKLNGRDLRATSLLLRKDVLNGLDMTNGLSRVPIQEADNLVNQLDDHLGAGYEGIIVKDKMSTYAPGKRSPSWLKLKKFDPRNVDIVGATTSTNSTFPFGALIMAKDGRYYGKVGTGFTLESPNGDVYGNQRESVIKIVRQHAMAQPVIALPNDVKNELLINCSPLPAEIKAQEDAQDGPRFPVWVRWRLEA